MNVHENTNGLKNLICSDKSREHTRLETAVVYMSEIGQFCNYFKAKNQLFIIINNRRDKF